MRALSYLIIFFFQSLNEQMTSYMLPLLPFGFAVKVLLESYTVQCNAWKI